MNYELDISKPIGQRIQNLSFKGQPVQPTQNFRLATNNYRVNGGGGYTMYKDARVVYRSSELIRDLIIDWVERHKTIPTQQTIGEFCLNTRLPACVRNLQNSRAT